MEPAGRHRWRSCPRRRAFSVDDPATIAEVAAGIERANGHLSRVEQIKKFKVVAKEWLPGSDELTPTMKIKRKSIAAKYAAQIEELYAG
ncbi:hypothetical protein [Variovorax sp. LjRoot178]|uniref:hypothetical protein n=1 Tax=Variovorax sp. LjRoot178 TaxID=3342277 RepID=UPI003F51582F